jgi:serine/threonine-protein kinase
MKRVHPRQIGAFEIIAHLDTGGMARVYLSRHIDDASLLGVTKILKPELADDANATSGMAQEGRVMARLRHPNVVRLYQHGTADGLPFITMEYLPGENFSALRRAARRRGLELSPTLATRLLLQASNALEYIHGLAGDDGRPLGLVHRDISPQNLLCTYSGQVKLLDFGIALAPDREVKTATGLIKGKLRYMSPEQIQGLPLDGKSDVFSLGIVGWELLAGRPLFQAESEYKCMRLICEEPIPDLRRERPDLPEPLAGALMACLERDRDKRPTAGQARDALSGWLFSGTTADPREIERFADDVLAGARARREELITSLRQSDTLREFLFRDLEEELDGETAHTPSQPAVHVAFSALSSREERAHQAPVPEIKTPRARWTRWALAGAGLATAALAISLWLAGRPPTTASTAAPPAAGDAEEAAMAQDAGGAAAPDAAAILPDAGTSTPAPPAEADEASGGDVDSAPPGDSSLDAGEPSDAADAGDRGPPVGFLRVRTRPPLDAFLDERYLGQTPIEDIELPPGRYRLLLQDAARRTLRAVTVRIRPGEVASFEYIF